MILAIDPGTTQSAYVIMGKKIPPYKFDKLSNQLMESVIGTASTVLVDSVVIEMVTSYGKPVGQETFETCRWIGRFEGAARNRGLPCYLIPRREVKKLICGKNDTGVRRMLIDRFAKFDKKTGKGTKDNPDWFYGFKADIWQAYAAGVAWMDKQEREN